MKSKNSPKDSKGYSSVLIDRALKDWGRWRGIITVLLGLIGFGLLEDWMKVLSAVVSAAYASWFLVLLLLVVPKRMWEESQREVAGLKHRLRPKLELVVGNNMRPYVQEMSFIKNIGVTMTSDPVWFERRYRVGVRNRGSAPATAELVLEQCVRLLDLVGRRVEHNDNVFPHHALQVMGEASKSTIVPPSGKGGPTKFFDIAFDQYRREERTDGLYLAYFQGLPNFLPCGTYLLTLRLDGDSAPIRRPIILIKETREDELRLYIPAW